MATYPSTVPGDAGDVALANYIRSGMGGSVPRPEITGNDMRDLIYFIRRSSLAGSYPTPVNPGPDDLDTSFPVISAVTAMRLTSPSNRIQVTWTTDVPTIGFVACGSPNQAGFNAPYSVFSDIESGFGTSHNMIVSGLPVTTPTHYTVVARNNAGQCSHTADAIVGTSPFSPDGAFIDALAGGGGPATLLTRYGTISWGDRQQSPATWFPTSPFCVALLNGKQMQPNRGFPHARLEVNFGGRLFGVARDELWDEWAGYYWQPNGGANFASGPAATPNRGPLPSFTPPYTPSPENTSISGGTGTLQIADGIFGFGAVNGAGWDMTINGIPFLFAGSSYPVNLLTVYGHGQLFLRITDGTWYVWAGNQINPSTGPTSSPVPINVTFPPIGPNPTIPTASPIGTLVTNIAVTMSDGSVFAGTITIDGTADFVVSGTSIVTATSPVPLGAYGSREVTVSRNGSSFLSFINVYSS